MKFYLIFHSKIKETRDLDKTLGIHLRKGLFPSDAYIVSNLKNSEDRNLIDIKRDLSDAIRAKNSAIENSIPDNDPNIISEDFWIEEMETK